jgi:hypothetical protein
MGFKSKLHGAEGHRWKRLEIGRFAAQSINSGVFTVITFDTELSDPEGLFDIGTPAQWIVPARSFVAIMATVRFAPNVTGTRRIETERVGVGGDWPIEVQAAAGAGDQTILSSTIFENRENATPAFWELSVMQRSGVAINVEYADVRMFNLGRPS